MTSVNSAKNNPSFLCKTSYKPLKKSPWNCAQVRDFYVPLMAENPWGQPGLSRMLRE